MRPHFLMLDFETRSELNLKTASYRRYASHPSTGVLCLGMQWSAGLAWVAVPHDGGPVFTPGQPVPPEIVTAIEQGIPVYAHNVAFDQRIYQHVCVERLGWPAIPKEQWYDLLAVASYYCLPRGLAELAKALHLRSQKSVSGGVVLSQVKSPRKPRKAEVQAAQKHGVPVPTYWWDDSARLRTVYEYCRIDVETQTEALLKLGPLPGDRLKDWRLDQEINERGIGVDWAAVYDASLRVDESLAGYDDRLKELTQTPFGPMVTRVTQRARMLDWLSLMHVNAVSLDKKSLDNLLARPGLPDNVVEVLTIRKEAGKSSLGKLETLSDLTDTDWRLRDSLLWHGASTGRWTGKGFQPHNLPRDAWKPEDMRTVMRELAHGVPFSLPGSVPEILSQAIRGFLVPRSTHAFYISDFNAIECRVMAWLAHVEPFLQAFRDKTCPYTAFASQATGIPVDQIGKKSDERKLGKVSILALQYGMGGTPRDGQPSKFQDTAKAQAGLVLSDEESQAIVKLYRATYPEIPAFWGSIEDAFTTAIEEQRPVQCGRVVCASNGDWASIRLPSGRLLWYPNPYVEEGTRAVRRGNGFRHIKTKVAWFWGVNPKNHQWVPQSTWGGTLTENVVQAIAADVLTAAIHRVNAEFPVVLSVHDEIISEARHTPEAFRRFHQLMEGVPPWAAGMPIACESEHMERYGKP